MVWPATADTTVSTASKAHRTTLGFTAFSSGYRKLASAIGGAIGFFASLVPALTGQGSGPHRMQDATRDPSK
jgi:hypothetical protein